MPGGRAAWCRPAPAAGMDENTTERESNRPLSGAARRLEDQLTEWNDSILRLRDEARLKAHLGARELAARREALENERKDLAQRLERAGYRVAEGAEAVGGELGAAWRRGLETLRQVKHELERR
jgi:hypothetical protein